MKIAISGLGNMGARQLLAPICEAHSSEAVIGFDPDPEARAKARQAYGIQTVDQYQAVLNDPRIGLVFIASPNHTHEAATVAALEAGKAVLCEKPMANTLAGAERMVRTAETLGRYLQIGFELRYSTLYTWAQERIAQGLIGQVVNTHCTYICSEFIGRDSWRHTLKGSGGMFGEKLSHYVDLPRWWIGSPVTDVLSVCAPNVVPYYEVRDNYHTTCRYENGAVSHLAFMMVVAPTLDPIPQDSFNFITHHSDDGHELRYLIQGTQGAMETDVYQRRFRRWQFTDQPRGLKSELVEDLTWDPNEDQVFVHNTTDQALDVIERVAAGRPAYTNPRDALETMRVVFAAEQSADTGKPVSLSQDTRFRATPRTRPGTSGVNVLQYPHGLRK